MSSIKKPVKWDGVGFVNNVQYGEEGVSMEILQNWKRQNSFLGASFMFLTRTKLFQRRAEVAKTSQKHQGSSDEGTDDSSGESRDSTTKNIFSVRKRIALSPINAIRHYRSISNVGDTNMFLNMKLLTAPC